MPSGFGIGTARTPRPSVCGPLAVVAPALPTHDRLAFRKEYRRAWHRSLGYGRCPASRPRPCRKPGRQVGDAGGRWRGGPRKVIVTENAQAFEVKYPLVGRKCIARHRRSLGREGRPTAIRDRPVQAPPARWNRRAAPGRRRALRASDKRSVPDVPRTGVAARDGVAGSRNPGRRT